MIHITREFTQPHFVRAAGVRGRASIDRGLIARLGWDLSDLNQAVYHSPTTVGSSLLVGEMLAVIAR